MKKTVSLMLTAMLAVQFLMAQIPAGIKFLNYEKNKSAKEAFQKAYDANPKDPQAIYWLGQSMLTTDGEAPTKEQVAAVKELYRKGLQEAGSDAWLLVGMGHVELLERGDMNSVKQKFEQAITATTETKGKNKGKPNPDILNAIGRSNAFVPSGTGDHAYAIDKLKQAAAIDLTNPDIMINMGINYLKMGGENGGEAVKAYQDAIARDPKNARAFYRIGKIYQSQNNKDLFEQNFNNAIAADPAFPPVYIAYFNYYANRDVNVAKEYLDKYVANADKLPENDLYLADYLFRAAKYAESIAKVKELDAAVGTKALPKLNLLYALNYDRTGDSVQAKSSLEKYFASMPADQLNPADYDLAVKVFSKFPGSEAQAVTYLEKAIASDTSKQNKLGYMAQAADLFGKAKNYAEQYKWLQKRVDLKGGAPSEKDYYDMATVILNSKDYPASLVLAKKYLLAYPDKPQPYTFLRRAAFGADPDSVGGILFENLSFMDSMYMTMGGKDKYKTELFRNQYPLIMSYLKKQDIMKKDPELKVRPDNTKPDQVVEFLAITQKLLTLAEDVIAEYPDPADQNNKFAQDVKAAMLKYQDYFSKPPQPVKKGAGGGASGAAGKGK
ncbi:MAG: tetratricopeptide repeat protein [Bacteroidota bacterium]